MKKIEEIIQTKFASSQQKALVNVRYTSNYLINIQNNFMLNYELSMPQFNVLRILRGAKQPISVQEIKSRMVEKSPNTTRLIDKLSEKQFVQRVENNFSDDKRKNFISITNSGLNILAEIDKNNQFDSLFTNKITTEEAELLSDLLDKLRS